MTALERLTQRATVRSGLITLAGLMVLAPSSTAGHRVGFVAAADDNGTAIRPFTFHASDGDLADLRRRVAATKWPERETVADTTQGVQLATMQKLARLLDNVTLYWLTNTAISSARL
jgi:hypothetical protein